MSQQIREIPYGSRVFIFVRPKNKDWSELTGSSMTQGRDFRPAMLSGA